VTNGKRLGRGLGALIPTADESGQRAADPAATYAELEITSIRPNPRQPRQVFDEESLAELTHSITDIGLLQPVVVRPVADGFELVAGERRWRAAQAAGLGAIPAIIRRTADDDLLREALLENIHRVQLNPLEEAAAYAQLLSDFGGTQEELAARLGRSRPQVANTLRLLKLPVPVQRRVAAGVLSAGHARALLSLDDPAAMSARPPRGGAQGGARADRVVAEGWSVRSLEEFIVVGEADGRARQRTPRPRGPKADYPDLVERLESALETRVRIAGSRRGRITVEFADAADLLRIVDAIAPE
jgi:ParB family chromosome partitioning protein